MRDAQRLETAFQSGQLIRPDENQLNIVDLANSIALLSGVDTVKKTQGVHSITGMIGETQHLVFVMVDGFGASLLDSLGPNSFVSQYNRALLRTVFPTTTASALVSLFTGDWPERHGAVGWYTYLSELNSVATIIPFVRSIDQVPLTELGLTADQVYPVPSLLGRFTRTTLSLLPDYICGSVFSTYCSGAGRQEGYRNVNEAIGIIADRINGTNVQTYTYLYISDVDSTAHKFGFGSDETLTAARHVDQLLSDLYKKLTGHVRIVVSSDHGGLDVRSQNAHYITESGPFTELLMNEPAGDSRVGYFNVQPGAEIEFETRFRELFGDSFCLLSVDDTERLRLFGPGQLTDIARARMGTFVSVSMGIDVLLYNTQGRMPPDRTFVGHHSGLSPSEVFVPLIII